MGSAYSNIISISLAAIPDTESVQAAGDFLGGALAAFLPPVGNSVESIQSAADFIGGSFSSADPFFPDVSLLLHMDGTNGSTLFPDASLNAFTVTRIGGVAVDTGTKEFGTGSASFNGTTGILTVPALASGPLDLVTGNPDSTVEFWMNAGGQPSGQSHVLTLINGTTAMYDVFFNSGVQELVVQVRAATAASTPALAIPLNTWTAIAIVMNASVMTIFVNGVAVGSPTFVNPGIALTDTVFEISGFSGASLYAGFIDELRVTKGLARYTSNYTPAGPFPNS